MGLLPFFVINTKFLNGQVSKENLKILSEVATRSEYKEMGQA
jgi:hypothetical protein